jgi:hypothetical protein
MKGNNELQRIWKEEVMALFKVSFLRKLSQTQESVSRHLLETSQDRRRLRQLVWCDVSNMRTYISDQHDTKIYAIVEVHFLEKVKRLY